MDDLNTFRVKIAAYKEHHSALAKCFEVPESTVQRWATGVAIPLPRMRQAIIDRLNCLCGQCIWCKPNPK